MKIDKHQWVKEKGMYSAVCSKCGMKRMDHTPINGAKIAPSYSTIERVISTPHEPPCI